jgi:hypothetical protein
MKPDNRSEKRSNKNRTAKVIAAMPIAGIVVVVSLLLSGLSVVGSSYNPALAQQNMTDGGGGNATTTGAAGENQAEVMLHLEEVHTALQNNDIPGAMVHLELAMNLLGGGTTQGNMTSTTGPTNSTA